MRELVKPDTALFLREQAILRFPDWGVSRTEPPGPITSRTTPLLLIYSQDVSRAGEWTWSETIGYRVFAGTREDDTEAREAAAQVEAWLQTAPMMRNTRSPVAVVTDSNGPNIVVDEHETAVLYGTVEMVIAGVFASAKAG